MELGVFDGSQIRTCIRDKYSIQKINFYKKTAQLSFVDVVKKFCGNNKAPYYETLVFKMLSGFHNFECNMYPKVHFLHRFPENLGVSAINRDSISTRITRQSKNPTKINVIDILWPIIFENHF